CRVAKAAARRGRTAAPHNNPASPFDSLAGSVPAAGLRVPAPAGTCIGRGLAAEGRGAAPLSRSEQRASGRHFVECAALEVLLSARRGARGRGTRLAAPAWRSER